MPKRHMKRILLCISSLALVLCLAGGCDFLRALAGRPTSAEIEIKRREIAAEEAAHQARLDSLKKAEKQIADSLAVIDSLKSRNETMLNPSKLGGLKASELPGKYYIIVGAFMEKANAEKKAAKLKESGYEATLISFRNGYNAVGICPSATLAQVYESLRKIQGQDFCPKDAWILVNE